jgi:hypothetical protein
LSAKAPHTAHSSESMREPMPQTSMPPSEQHVRLSTKALGHTLLEQNG